VTGRAVAGQGEFSPRSKTGDQLVVLAKGRRRCDPSPGRRRNRPMVNRDRPHC
jgi:hypothetical protein